MQHPVHRFLPLLSQARKRKRYPEREPEHQLTVHRFSGRAGNNGPKEVQEQVMVQVEPKARSGEPADQALPPISWQPQRDIRESRDEYCDKCADNIVVSRVTERQRRCCCPVEELLATQ